MSKTSKATQDAEERAKESAKTRLFKALEAKAVVLSLPEAKWMERFPEFAQRVREEQQFCPTLGEAMHRALTVIMAEVLTICL
jgi:hypothetical protein